MTDSGNSLMWLVLAGIAIVVAVLVWWIVRKGRLVAGPHVFRASRWSRGNHLFPTQVAVTPTSVVQYTPQWMGVREHSVHMAHIASVEVDTDLFFSDVLIETSGGTDPVRCHGHRKGDAVEMKRLINEYQTAYYGNRSAENRNPNPMNPVNPGS